MSRVAAAARTLLGVALGAVLVAAGYESVERAWADWLFRSRSPAAAQRAAAVAPSNADYRSASGSTKDLEAAVRLNRYHTAARIELALRAEFAGDLRRAESLLLEAARFDRTYQPLWALANFYFRRGDRRQFFRWAHAANEMAYFDQSALFDLCWRISQDGAEILREVIPDRVPILAQYLDFLIRQGRLEDAGAAAERLFNIGGPEQAPLLVAYADALIRAQEGAAARRWWNRLAARRFIPHAPLTPEAPLANGDFRAPALGAGFDWRLAQVQGVYSELLPSAGQVRFSFSGSQPEQCRLLEQIVLLPAGRSCRLRFRYRTTAFGCPSGLGWSLTRFSDGAAVPLDGHDLCGDSWREAELRLSAPPQESLARLALDYARRPGTTRIEGELRLTGVTLACEVQDP
jgi:tetratricopeptide (TPR) repeat protein